jgi:hypothetical protein
LSKLFCLFGIHSYKTIDMTDCFTTSYSDRPSWSPIRHMVWYQQCSCCKKRRLKDTVKKDNVFSSRHNGVEYARIGWVEYGKMYKGNGESKMLPPSQPKPKKPKLKVVEGGRNDNV